jgi:hypothetical protein
MGLKRFILQENKQESTTVWAHTCVPISSR